MMYMFAALQRIAEQRGDGLLPELAARLREMPRPGDNPDHHRRGARDHKVEQHAGTSEKRRVGEHQKRKSRMLLPEH
jgi:hypothetical protein